MKRVMTVVAGVLLASTAWADDIDSVFTGCNTAGLAKINAVKPDGDYAYGWPLGDLASHVFYSRLGNKGKGNGGEAYDLHFWGELGGVFGVDCISTADEDTGGGLYSGDPADAPYYPNSVFAPEVDPGK